MWFNMQEEYVELFISARPASSKNEIVGIFNDTLKIKVKAPAVEGAANKELVKFISKQFKVPKSEILFISGETSKRKCIRLPRTEQLEAWIEEMQK
ncbi:DUF167 domain-containing protein [Hydrogenimonas thermophila]|uniref:UPF0235 protein SAMN05216234_13130 n=1 Tax=Hydrogenimonas thermophila TaxID=223786 RepID=A0A1I5S7T7_9BACT|nr:DUF167 domain-containing protein [Hydrogenimonas thermophila]WOE69529.1 DUF167 domain-containing protein [Hydrogenimonas thermophila]WOE72043.1 DUF167 domain-containing protein [Hydrogenimonas thermophila]SFP66751.1 hypothetical protein SAMN05216234_13130 [Hydrogenimonas thermophila]